MKWLFRRGYELPEDLLGDSQKCYDLKIFRWLLKHTNTSVTEENLAVFQNQMYIQKLSEEKLQFLVDHGKKGVFSHPAISNLDSLQAARFLLRREERGWIKKWTGLGTQDPRLATLLNILKTECGVNEETPILA
jgi:hypothetical protein